MSENIKLPFEKAIENAKIFTETADMLQSLAQLQKVIDECKDLSQEEQEGVDIIVEASLKTLSDYLSKRGHGWN